MSACRSCGAPLIWAKTAKGKMMPVDAAPDPEGNIELVPVGSEYLARVVPDVAAYGGDRRFLHKPHFATCPYADSHRGKRAKR